jgi:hypothetical protein
VGHIAASILLKIRTLWTDGDGHQRSLDLEESMGAAGVADLGDDGGAVGVGEVDDGDVGVGDDLVQARALRLLPDVVARQLLVHGRGDELVRHEHQPVRRH